MPRKKRSSPPPGSLFAVYDRQGHWRIGQIAGYNVTKQGEMSSPTCVIFAEKVDSQGGARAGPLQVKEESPLTPIAFATVVGDILLRGGWPVVGFRAQIHPAAAAHVRRLQTSMIGVDVSSDGILVDFCDAYDGAIAWNGYFDPLYFNRWLLPGIPVPPHVLMRCQQCRLVRSAMDAARTGCPRCSA